MINLQGIYQKLKNRREVIKAHICRFDPFFEKFRMLLPAKFLQDVKKTIRQSDLSCWRGIFSESNSDKRLHCHLSSGSRPNTAITFDLEQSRGKLPYISPNGKYDVTAGFSPPFALADSATKHFQWKAEAFLYIDCTNRAIHLGNMNLIILKSRNHEKSAFNSGYIYHRPPLSAALP